MAVPKRKSEYLGLKNLDVLQISQDILDSYFRILECPDVLTQGKSSFLIAGSVNLKPGVDIKIELVHDQTDEVIYVEPIMGHLEGDARRVSIEVYDDVTPGPYTLYVVGELNPENVNVPAEWQGIYNARWSKPITINGMGVNTQPILFHRAPTVKVTELFKEFVQVPSGSSTSVNLAGDGVPRAGLSPEVPVENATIGGVSNATYPNKDFKDKAKQTIIEENKPLTKLSGKSGAIGSKGKLVETMSPVMDDFYINLSGSSSVDSKFVGEPITINNPQVDTSQFTLESYHSVPTIYTSSVMNVLNDKTFVPKDIFYVNDDRTSPPTLVPAPLSTTSAITASYVELPTQTTSSINFTSFADITIQDMKTFSGDVHKVKIYAKSEGSLGDFELIYDSPIESAQVLFDKNETTLNTNIGYFIDVGRINNYWEIHEGQNGNGGTGTFTFSSAKKVDSMVISGSNLEHGDSVRVQNKTSVDFIKGNLYNFSAKVYGIKTDKKDVDGNLTSNAEFIVYTSGSAFNTENNEGNHWGDEKLNLPDFPTGVSEYDFGLVEGSFLADNTGTGVIQFKAPSGVWHVSDIQVKAATDTAFHPDFVTITAPVPPLLERPDRIRFLVEFYDVNNNIADTTVFTNPIDFTGPNINISGTDNILSGSMFIGSALASGVEMAGVNSAFIRSMGYQGFKSASNATGENSGFMMFSGSVLPDSGDDYKGVGLELVGNSGSYLKFRTDPSELDIRADAFFVGNEGTQFVSGALGNVEISSSNFHLSSSGDVNMSGTITATAGNIGNWKIVDGMLSGSNATLDADGAALYHSTKGPGSDTAAAFDITRDEYYIDFTPEQGDTATAGRYYVKFGPNFSVSASGVLFASGAVFEGKITSSAGLIGGAQIESTSLAYPPHWRISSSAATDDPVSFISSSQFKVSADGRITASAANIEGKITATSGRIANWDIIGDTLSSVNASNKGIILDADNSTPIITVQEDSNNKLELYHTTATNWGIKGISGGDTLFRLGNSNQIAGWAISGSWISKAISGSAAYQDFTRVYMSSVNDNTQNIQEGFSVYRKDEDIDNGAIKVVRLGGLSDTTDLHAINDYGLQIIQKDSNNNYSNLLFIGSGSQNISGWNLTTSGFHDDAGSIRISSTQASMSLGTSDEVVIRGNSNNPYISLQPSVALASKAYGATGVFLGVSGGSTPKFSAVGTGGHIKFDGAGLDIDTTTFELDANTGDLQISSGHKSMSLNDGTIVFDGANAKITIGSANKVTIQGGGTDNFMTMGSKTSFTHFDQSTAGIIVGMDSTVPKMELVASATNYLSFDGSNFDIKLSQGLELDATNIEISSLNASMSLGEGNILLDGANSKIFVGSNSSKQIEIFGNSSKGYIRTGKSSVSDTTEGFWFANNNANPEFHIGDATDFIKLQHGNLDIASQKLEISASTIQVSTTQASMSLGHSPTYPKGKIIIEGEGTPTFRMGPDADFISLSTGSGIFMDGDGNFRFGDADGGILFENGNFNITGSDIDINVTELNITATGFQLSSGQASMSLGTNRQWLAQGSDANPYLAIGQTGGTVGYGHSGVFLGYNNAGSAPRVSFVGSSGHFKFTGAAVDIDTNTFEMAASNIQLSSAHASMSLGGVPGAAANILLDGGNSRVEVGSANKVTIQGGNTDNFITMGSKTSFSHFDQSTEGIIIGMDSTVPKLEIAKNSANYFSFDGTNFDIKLSEGFELDATNIEISSTHASMSIGDGKIKMVGGSTSTLSVGAANAITLKDDGTDRFLVIGSKTSFSHFDQSTAGVILGTDSGTTKFEIAGNATNYLSFDGTNFDVKLTEGLELDATNIELSSTHASMSLGEGKIKMVGASTSFITIGAANAITLKDDGTDRFLAVGSKTSFSHFDQSTAGVIFGTDGGTTKFELAGSATNYLSFDGTNFDIKLSEGLELDATNIEISSTHASMSIGEGKILLDGANGKMTVGTSNKVTIQGGGTDNFITMGSKTSFSHEGSGTAGILIGMDGSNPQAEFVKNSSDYFIFDDGIDIKTTAFELSTTNLDLSSTHASMSLGEGKILLVGASSPYFQIGDSNPITIKTDGTDQFIVMGSKTSFSHYDKSTVGIILGMDAAVPKFEMAKSGDEYLRWDSTDGLDIRTKNLEVSASNLEVSSQHASMSIGDPNSSGGAIVLHADGTDKMLKFGGKTTFDQTTTAGLIMGMDATNPEFDYTVGTGNNQYLRMTPAGIDIKTPAFKLDTDRLDIDSSTSRIDVYDASDGLRVRIGEIDPTGGDQYGLVIYDGSGTAGADEIAHFGSDYNKIASWSISTTQISSENIVIDSAGIIQTSDFASGVQGWRITSANNGEAEFEKVTVRGTLATTVFEKESVNAVGGQLYVANSTIISSSTDIAASDTTMSVANVGGFVANEVISAKKVSDTGFQTEYMLIQSASRDVPSSDTNFMGKLFVVRGYSGSLETTSGSVGDAASSAQTYSQGQVIVSTGKVGTGFIRLNANPNDTTTPYIDIVERTGSAVFDVELKTRLGDLSGLSSGLLYGETNPGFGLFAENVFLQGGITAQTGSITGKLHVRTDASNQVVIGTDVQSTNDGIFINNNNYWYTTGAWKVGGGNFFISNDASGNVSIQPNTFELSAGSGDIQISSTHKSMSLGDGDIFFQSPNSSQAVGRIGATSTKAIFITGSSTQGAIRSGKTSVSDTTEGFWLANNNTDAEFVVGDGTDFLKFDDNALTVKTRAFELAANTDDLQISAAHKSMSLGGNKITIQGAASPSITIGSSNAITIKTDGTDQFLTMGSKTSFTHEGSGTAGILIGMDGSNPQAEFVKNASEYFIFDNGVDIKTVNFELDANSGDLQISSAHKSMSLGGQVTLDGTNTKITVGSSNAITIQGGNTDNFIAMGSKGSFSNEGSGTAGILIGMDATNPQAEFVKSATNYFIFDGGTGVDIKTTTFELDASNLELSSTHSSMSLGEGKIVLQGSSTPFITVGSSNPITIKTDGTDQFITMGSKTSFSHEGSGTAGILIGMDSTNPQAEFVKSATNYFIFDDGVDIKTEDFELDASNIEISSTNASMSIGEGKILLDGANGKITVGTSNSVTIQGGSTDNFMAMGSKTSFSQEGSGTAGILIGMDATNPQAEFVKSATNYFIFDGGTGVDIKTTQLDLAAGTTDLQISSTHKSMSLNNGNVKLLGSGNVGYAQFGSAPALSDNLIISASATQQVLKAGVSESFAGAVANNEQGFILERALTTTKFHVGSGTEYIRFDGTNIDIAAANFNLTASNVNITAGDGIEVDAPDFEVSSTHKSMSLGYNTSANGGITMVGGDTQTIGFGNKTGYRMTLQSDANDSFLQIGSPTIANPAQEGILIANDGGNAEFHLYKNSTNYFKFDAGATPALDVKTVSLEIATQGLTISGRDASTAANNKIALGSASSKTAGAGAWIDGAGNFRVGTATSGNSFMYFDASSNNLAVRTDDLVIDTSTVDITTEHGGMIALGATSASLADLSGAGIFLSGSGEFNFEYNSLNYIKRDGTDFKIGSQNFSLSGSTTLAIDTSKIRLGSNATSTLVHGSEGIFLNSSGHFSFKEDANNYIIGGNNNFDIAADNFTLDATTIYMDSAVNSGMIGLGTDGSAVTHGATGIYLDGTGKFSFVEDGANFIKGGNSNFEIQSEKFDLLSSNLRVSSSGGGTIAMGSTIPTTLTSNGVLLSGSGDFNFQGDANNFLRFSSNTLQLKASELVIDTAKVDIDTQTQMFAMGGTSASLSDLSTNGIFFSGSGEFNLQQDSNNFIKRQIIDGTSKLNIKTSTFDLVTDTLQLESTTPKLQLDDAGAKLIVGSLDSVTDVTDGDSGLYAQGDGLLLMKHDANNYIQFNSGLVIKAQNFDLNTSTLRVSSSNGGVISLGATPPTSATSGTGFFVSGSGNEFLVGNASGNRIQYTNNAIVLQSNTFALTTATLVIDSATNSGKIAMGSTPNTSVAGTNAGIYMDGTGDFLAYGNASNFIKKDGTSLEMKSTTFNLTANTNDLVIDSAGHSISLADGNITLDGTSTGFFEIGTLADTSTIATTNSGMRVDGAGNFLLKADDSGTNFIKFDVDGGDDALQISSSNFRLSSAGAEIKGDISAETGYFSDVVAGGGTADVISGTNSGKKPVESWGDTNSPSAVKSAAAISSDFSSWGRDNDQFGNGDQNWSGSAVIGNLNPQGITNAGSFHTIVYDGRDTAAINNTLSDEQNTNHTPYPKATQFSPQSLADGHAQYQQSSGYFSSTTANTQLFRPVCCFIRPSEHRWIAPDELVNGMFGGQLMLQLFSPRLTTTDFYAAQGASENITFSLAWKLLGFANGTGGAPDFNCYLNIKLVKYDSITTVYDQQQYRFTEGTTANQMRDWYTVNFTDIMSRISNNDIKVMIEFYVDYKDDDSGPELDLYGFAMTELKFKKESKFISGFRAGTGAIRDHLALGVTGSAGHADIIFKDTDPLGSGVPAYRFSVQSTCKFRFNKNVESVGSFVGSVSDERLKDNIEIIDDPLTKIGKLKGVTFDWKEEAGEVARANGFDTETGLIAQDIENVIPDAVIPAPFNQNYKTINYDKAIPLLVEGIKKLTEKVNQLEATISGSNSS